MYKTQQAYEKNVQKIILLVVVCSFWHIAFSEC